MTIASLLLTLLTAVASPAGDSTAEPVLLDFHAEWCGPCQRVRPAVQQLIRAGYPIKQIDIDRDPKLASRYRVEGVPTFIVVDGSGRELDRTSGLQPAAALAQFYKTAAAKARPPAGSNAHVGSPRESRSGAGDDDDEIDAERRDRHDDGGDRPTEEFGRALPVFTNPKPWETVVRIRVISSHSTGFGSGTIIHSTPDESVILTCAHIFKIDGRKQAHPKQFPHRIMIDLFDGNLQGTNPARVHFLESVAGSALDYDFTRDVGLIRIHPGRRLPASRVVPAHWQPQARMKVLTVGCPEGADATVWHTVIKRPRILNFLSGNPSYEAVECDVAPKQGRSGGGLFTIDGYIAGVCNFAEPQGDHGLYATPRSIYTLLDRNNMMALYAPATRGSADLLADGRPGGQPHRNAPVSIVRSQSPDNEEADRSRGSAGNGDVMIPPPSLLGIADPVSPRVERSPQAASGTTRRTAWHPTHDASAPARAPRMEKTEQTDLNLDPSADHDRFGPLADEPRNRDSDSNVAASTSTSNPAPSSGSPSKSRWKAVKAVPANSEAGTAAN
ncbi:MAG: thioredoxin domain-containing protein [Isosphaerales bacterium]